MKIDKLDLASNVVLAPIAGYSDVGFRKICAEMGAGLTYTEMVSAKGLCYASEKTQELLHTTKSEKLCAVQIFGSEPYYIEKAVSHVALQKFDLIDINMGCPVPKIVKNGEGSALLNNPKIASEIVKSACKGDKPISVKMRIGFENHSPILIDFAKLMQDSGASALAIHGRTRAQQYSGKADWEAIANIVRAVSIPVFANGDVASEDDYKNILATTGAQGVMVARGALGNPFLFSEITKKNTQDLTLGELIITHINTMLEYHSEKYVLNNMKKHLAYYCHKKTDAKQFKLKVFASDTINIMKNIIKDYFEVGKND